MLEKFHKELHSSGWINEVFAFLFKFSLLSYFSNIFSLSISVELALASFIMTTHQFKLEHSHVQVNEKLFGKTLSHF